MSNPTDQLVLADLYDYPSAPYIQTHPDRLATLALLAGMRPAPVDNCRVLEVACGEGSNILSMAYTLPNSTFLGMDLGKIPIDKANAAVDALGLKNVRFISQNLMDFDPGSEKFDYVIAHGFYSWVPAVVREKLLAMISEVLAPQGIAYISYNVYPGCYSGNRLRDFAFLHLDAMRAANPGSLETPNEMIHETLRLIHLLDDHKPEDASPPRGDLFYEANLVRKRVPALVFHDLLSDHWNPFTFKQFLSHADRYGLQFLDEATAAEPDLPKVPDAVMRFIRETCGGDRLLELQYIDYIIARRFRRSLVCRKEVTLEKQDQTGVVGKMYATTRLTEGATDANGSVTFSIPDFVTVSTPAPAVISILRRLISAHPQRVAIKDFEGEDEESKQSLYALFVRMYRAGSVELYTQPGLAGAPTGRPRASALVRYQSNHQVALSNLLHQGIELRDENASWFLNLLDGTRDHAMLLEEIVRKFPDRPRNELANQLYVRLDELRKLAILHDQDA